jgi:hypothetical protein
VQYGWTVDVWRCGDSSASGTDAIVEGLLAEITPHQ